MALSRTISAKNKVFTVFTFGDSILDCGRYNEYGVHPGQLIVRNNDFLFPEFKGRDLMSQSASMTALPDHRARDGSVVDNLSWQARGIKATGPAVALVTVGGNDLLAGLAADRGEGIACFQQRLDAFLQALPVRPVLLGTVYDRLSAMTPAIFLPPLRALPGPSSIASMPLFGSSLHIMESSSMCTAISSRATRPGLQVLSSQACAGHQRCVLCFCPQC